MNVVLDTSVFIARESGRPLGALPALANTAISVMTIAELRVGVLVAGNPTARALRLSTLVSATRDHDPLPVDDAVAEHFARLVAQLRDVGSNPRVVDTLIAATAIAHGAAVATQVADFDDLPGLEVVRV